MLMRFFVIFTILAASLPAFAAPEPFIRVAVFDNMTTVNMEAIRGGLLTIEDENGRRRSQTPQATFTATAKGLRLNGRLYGQTVITVAGKIPYYRIGDRVFSGKLRVMQKENKITVINDLPLEDYLTGLINSEISSSWPQEAIKAQVVAARTYALSQMDRARRHHLVAAYDVVSTIMDQVYAGAHQEDNRSREMVAATRGEVLQRNGTVFPAFYHSCCGGRTEWAKNVWNESSGPPPVEDRFCARSPKRDWIFSVSISEFQKTLARIGITSGNISSITTIPFFDSPRIDTVIIESDTGIQNIKATELRRLLGYANLKSTWFEVKLDTGKVIFTGRGYGHGVGLCQWGAKGKAEAGYDYREILKFYYPDAQVVRIY